MKPLGRYEKNQFDYYHYNLQYPKFLCINKIWVNEGGVEILVNTDYNQYYLLNLEPGNYRSEFGMIYGGGDRVHRELTGHLLPAGLLDLSDRRPLGLISYKTKRKNWKTFGHLQNESMALWLNRGAYEPSHIFKVK